MGRPQKNFSALKNGNTIRVRSKNDNGEWINLCNISYDIDDMPLHRYKDRQLAKLINEINTEQLEHPLVLKYVGEKQTLEENKLSTTDSTPKIKIVYHSVLNPTLMIMIVGLY